MSILGEFLANVADYAKDYMRIEIVNFQASAADGPAWDPGDQGSFNVKVYNDGDVDLKNVEIHVAALSNYGEVKVFSGPHPILMTEYAPSLDVTMPGTLAAGTSRDAVHGTFIYRADNDTGGEEKNLVRAYVKEYDVSIEQRLLDLYGGAAKGYATAEIREP